MQFIDLKGEPWHVLLKNSRVREHQREPGEGHIFLGQQEMTEEKIQLQKLNHSPKK